MLSRIFSRLFMIAFYFFVILSCFKLIATVLNKELSINSKNSIWTLAEVGMRVKAEQRSNDESKSNDTIVRFTYLDSLGNNRGGGEFRLPILFKEDTFLISSMRMAERQGLKINRDSTFFYMGEMIWHND